MIANPLAFRPRSAAVAPSKAFLPKIMHINAITREQKEGQVQKLKDKIENSGLVVIAKQNGLTVPETEKIRLKLAEGNATYQVIKNTLAKIALTGTDKESLTDMLFGPMAIIYASEPVSGAKSLKEVLDDVNDKDDVKLKIEGAVTEGQLLDEAGIEKLSKMPSIEEARTKLAVVLNQPATLVAKSINAVPVQLARALQLAIDEKKFPEA
jgi:large subunit ribosomal protein L10